MREPAAPNDDQSAEPGYGTLWLVLLGVVLVAAIAAAWWLGPILEPEVALLAPVDPTCDLKSGPCVGIFPDGTRVRFAVAPEGIPLVTPLELDVRVQGVQPSAVQVDFAGYDMDMGFNRSDLQATDRPGHFVGSGMLPICIRDHMTWEARVLLETPRGILAAPFRFETYRSKRSSEAD